MAKVSTYLNFKGQTEAAFNFYREVFGTDFSMPMQRMGDGPPMPGMPELSAEDKRAVMHVALPILGGHVLMGTDALDSTCAERELIAGNNVHLNLEPDTRAETERLFAALSEGGQITMPLQDMFWGAYHGACLDKFGTSWMLNCAEPKK